MPWLNPDLPHCRQILYCEPQVGDKMRSLKFMCYLVLVTGMGAQKHRIPGRIDCSFGWYFNHVLCLRNLRQVGATEFKT